MKLNRVQKMHLEDIIDRSTLSDVIDALAEICYEKSEHVLENWQDKALAREWKKAGAKLGRLDLTI